jgi:Flp pilus assembly protein TadD
MALLSLGRLDEAARSMDRAILLNRTTRSLLGRATIALRQNDPALARSLVDQAFALDPSDARVMQAKLQDLVQSKDDKAALALSERILKAFPKDVTTRAMRAEIFLRKNQDGRVRAELDAVHAIFPNTAMEHYYRAILLSRNGESDAAWKIAQTLPPSYMTSKTYAIPLFEMAMKDGRFNIANAILDAALARWPEADDIRLRLAELRLKQNNPASVIVILNPLKNSNNVRALDLLGQSRLQRWETAEALDAFRRANQLQPNNPEITFHLVLALDQSGDRAAAKALLRKLLTAPPAFNSLQYARQLERTWH